MTSAPESFRGHVVSVAVASVAAFSVLTVLLIVGGVISFQDRYTVRAVVPTAENVYPGATLRIAGLDVGEVSQVARAGRGAVLTLSMEQKYAPLRRDARVAVRLRTLAGENYVEVYPGNAQAPALEQGAVLPMSSALPTTDVDQILSVLDKRTRKRAQQMIQGFGHGVAGRGGQVNELTAGISGTVDQAAPVVNILAQERRQFARLVDGFGSVAQAIGERGASIRLLAHQGRVTAESLARRNRAMTATLDELPATLVQVRNTTTTLRSVTGSAAPVIEATATVLRDLQPTVKLLRPAASEGHAVVTELGRTAPRLEKVLARVRVAARPTIKALPQVHKTLCEADPVIRYLRPYTRELGVHTENLASGTNFYDATGHAARIHLLFSENTPVIFSAGTDRALNQLLSGGLLGKARQIGWNPYPKPGGIADVTTGRGQTGPSASTLPFPRVQPMC